jgi:transcriptional regulator with XRE-family HTH domain
MEFSDKLRQLRGKAGLSRGALAEASSLARGTIRDYEQGKRQPTLQSAAKLAAALGVYLDALATAGASAARRPTRNKK